jgi:hypothetical protein
MLEFFTYERVLVLVVLAVVSWIILILYRVGRGGVIKKIDFWRASWKIVLFWLVVLAVVAGVSYLLHKYGLIE